MNKHVILIAVLMTSAVSLHTLSYALDDSSVIIKEEYTPLDLKQVKTEKFARPEINIAKLPVVTKTDKIETQSKTEIKPVQLTENSKKEPVEKLNQSTQEGNFIPVSDLKTINYKLAYGLIPSKNYKEIVKEAKVAGGRVDPFLSLKPPEIDKLPELPVQEKQAALIPLPALQQEYPVIKPARPLKPFKPKKIFREQIKLKEKLSGVLTAQLPDIQEGFVLNGIITGTKPLALIKVDNVNRILGMGDIIFRKNQKITIVSIDNDSKAITISDNNNRKAKLEMD